MEYRPNMTRSLFYFFILWRKYNLFKIDFVYDCLWLFMIVPIFICRYKWCLIGIWWATDLWTSFIKPRCQYVKCVQRSIGITGPHHSLFTRASSLTHFLQTPLWWRFGWWHSLWWWWEPPSPTWPLFLSSWPQPTHITSGPPTPLLAAGPLKFWISASKHVFSQV